MSKNTNKNSKKFCYLVHNPYNDLCPKCNKDYLRGSKNKRKCKCGWKE